MRKTEMVRQLVREKNYKKALRIAKGFRIGISEEQRKSMTMAYECMIYPDLYRQLGKDIEQEVRKGIAVVSRLYGEKRNEDIYEQVFQS